MRNEDYEDDDEDEYDDEDESGLEMESDWIRNILV
jgi:hypothetical protein